MTENQLIQKEKPSATSKKKKETPLDKYKREFSTLLSTVERLKRENELREWQLREVRTRIDKEIKPLHHQIAEMRLALNELLERKMGEAEFSRREKKTLRELLFYNCEILEAYGMDMSETIERNLTKAEKKQQQKNDAVFLDLEDGLNDFFDRMEEKAQAQGERKSKKSKKEPEPETPPPIEIDPELKSKLDLQRHIRSLYLSLVKSIHPDLEPDTEKRVRRTEIMQHVTSAYQRLDLYELLKAKNELLAIEEEELESAISKEAEKAELEQLKQFIHILKKQQRELVDLQFQQDSFSSDGALLRKFYGSKNNLDKQFDREKKQFLHEINKIKQLRIILTDSREIRQYLDIVQDADSIEGYF